MGTAFEAMQKRWEERLMRLEERLKGVSTCGQRHGETRPAKELRDNATDAYAAEKKSLTARIQVQRREIVDLKGLLEESRRQTETLRDEFRQQQANVARLVEDWEKRLSTAHQRGHADGTEKAELEREIAFLRAEVETQVRRIEALAAQKQECEQEVLAKDREIVRLFTRIGSLEEENMALTNKIEQSRFAARVASAGCGQPQQRPKQSRKLFRWLSKPIIVIRTGNEITN